MTINLKSLQEKQTEIMTITQWQGFALIASKHGAYNVRVFGSVKN